MFQTQINHFLQSFQNDLLTWFFIFITNLGYEQALMVILLGLIFGIDFKKGILITHAVILTGLITELLKQTFALPRPFHVDSTIEILGKDSPNSSPFTKMGAKSFFGFLPSEVIEYYRLKGVISYGMPSGHTSTALVLWGSIIIFFKKFPLIILSISLIILIPLSRLYLGVHFPADVLGGYIIGAVLLFYYYKVIYQTNFQFVKSSKFNLSLSRFFIMLYLLITPLLFLLLFTNVHENLAGFLLGINIIYIIFSLRKMPENCKGIIKRVSSILAAVIIFSATYFLVTKIISFLYLHDDPTVKFAGGFIISLISISLSVIVNIKSGLLKMNSSR